MKDPTEEDWEHLKEILIDTEKLSIADLEKMDYEDEECYALIHRQIDLLCSWLTPFITPLNDSIPYLISKQASVCLQTEGFDFHITCIFINHEYLMLTLRWEESFIRSEMPEIAITGRQWEGIKGEMLNIPDSLEGFSMIARKIIEIDSR